MLKKFYDTYINTADIQFARFRLHRDSGPIAEHKIGQASFQLRGLGPVESGPGSRAMFLDVECTQDKFDEFMADIEGKNLA